MDIYIYIYIIDMLYLFCGPKEPINIVSSAVLYCIVLNSFKMNDFILHFFTIVNF